MLWLVKERQTLPKILTSFQKSDFVIYMEKLYIFQSAIFSHPQIKENWFYFINRENSFSLFLLHHHVDVWFTVIPVQIIKNWFYTEKNHFPSMGLWKLSDIFESVSPSFLVSFIELLPTRSNIQLTEKESLHMRRLGEFGLFF